MKKILLFFTILLILGLIYLFFSFLPSTQDENVLEPTKNTITPSMSPAEIGIVNIAPPNNKAIQYNLVQQLTVTFDRVIKPTGVLINTFPQTKTSVRQGEDLSTIIISADPAWTEGITKILIYVSGNTEPFIYELKSGYPPVPNIEVY
jgi:hypothetical protein